MNGSTRVRRVALAVIAVAATGLAACAAGPNDAAQVGAAHVAGFWPGLWQGFISPVTFIVSLFNHQVNIYEVHNNGGWYNFGFMLGVSAIFGGLHTGSTGRARRRPPIKEGDHDERTRAAG